MNYQDGIMVIQILTRCRCQWGFWEDFL